MSGSQSFIVHHEVGGKAVAPATKRGAAERQHKTLPFEPARSVGGTGAAQGEARWRLEPGRRRRLNLLVFGNTVKHRK